MGGNKLKTYADLPQSVTDFLLSDEVFERYQLLKEKFGLPEGSDIEMGRQTDAVVLGATRLTDFPDSVGKAFPLDPTKRKKLAAEIAGRILRAVEVPLGDVDAAIRSWGEDPIRFPRMGGGGKEPFENAMGQLEKDAGLSWNDDVLSHRLSLIAKSYVTGVRNVDDTKQVLMRDTNVGGLELSDEQATDLFSLLDNRKNQLTSLIQDDRPLSSAASISKPQPLQSQPKFVQKSAPHPPILKPSSLDPSLFKREKKELPSFPPPVQKLPMEPLRELAKREKAKLPPLPPSVQKLSTAAPMPADVLAPVEKKELQVLAKKTETLHRTHPPLLNVDEAVKEIIQDANVRFPNEEMKKRFLRIADVRLRDVRDAYETRTQLESSADQGGLGLAGRSLVDVMETIERVVQEYQKDLASGAAKQKQAAISEQREMKEKQEETLQKKEEQLLSRRYADLTGRAPMERVTTAVPVGSRSTAAKKSDDLLHEQMQKIDMDRVKQVVAAAQPVRSVEPRLSNASIPTLLTGRPNVDDVRGVRTLAGPVEEIGVITLVDFRRLSKDPKQAATKILDKVGLVEQQGYDQKIAAIKAWRSSPLNQMYMALTREALQAGKGVQAILEEKKKQGKGIFTAEELNAVLSLNASLRF